MKCIFSKNYKDAIVDFNKALDVIGESYVMDHSYYFYLGLCHLQLNEFETARDFFNKSIAQSVKEHGDDWIHFTDLMYLGIAEFELKNYEMALLNFDRALSIQPQFCEVKYYKALCYSMMGNYDESQIYIDDAKTDYLNGSVMFEDNTVYERYPYQIRESWLGL